MLSVALRPGAGIVSAGLEPGDHAFDGLDTTTVMAVRDIGGRTVLAHLELGINAAHHQLDAGDERSPRAERPGGSPRAEPTAAANPNSATVCLSRAFRPRASFAVAQSRPSKPIVFAALNRLRPGELALAAGSAPGCATPGP
jgi:hypothetical protein